MVFGKKKITKEFEKKLMEWVNKALEKGSDMEQITKVLYKKYPKKEVEEFLKKNYSVEPEAKPNKKLEEGLEEEKKKKEAFDELNTEMAEIKEEAKGEEIVTPGEADDVPPEKPEGTEEKGKEVPIQRMSTYDIELLNQVASINQGIMKLIEILSKK